MKMTLGRWTYRPTNIRAAAFLVEEKLRFWEYP
jgi:hypothetical protein